MAEAAEGAMVTTRVAAAQTVAAVMRAVAEATKVVVQRNLLRGRDSSLSQLHQMVSSSMVGGSSDSTNQYYVLNSRPT